MNLNLFRAALVFTVLLIFIPAASAGPGITELQLNSLNKMTPNGEFQVEMLSGGKWRNAGRLAYDRFLRERRLDLSGYCSKDKAVRIRIIQQGGGAAHVDAVLFGGRPPRQVEGLIEPTALAKISQIDQDLVESTKKTFYLDFHPVGDDQTLVLAARVESEIISTTPFQFPLNNLYRPMTERSRFYHYRPGSGAADRPFFKAWSQTGSGHPPGFTYGYVHDDGEHLYVTLDFTPDNTRDGDRDYAKVYVKAGEELREFKVSEAETKWGRPRFVYTDKVSYQHKVYDFKIPLTELGLESTASDQAVSLAFAAYGTAYPNDFLPDVAHEAQNDVHLLVYLYDSTDDILLMGQRINGDGTLLGGEITIAVNVATPRPAVVCDTVNQRFLAIWIKNGNVYGRLINPDGGFVGPAFAVCDNAANQSNPAAAFDPDSRRFLVVWQDERNANGHTYDVYGQLVNADGTLYGTASNVNFPVSTVSEDKERPQTAFDQANGRYLVVWEDYRSGSTWDIYGQLVNADGTLYGAGAGTNFAVSTAADDQYLANVAYDEVHQRYLVVWEDYRSSVDADVYGQLVNADGTLYGAGAGTNFAVSTPGAAGHQEAPCVVFDRVNQRFPAAWQDWANQDLFGQIIHPDGTLLDHQGAGGFLVADEASNFQRTPRMAYNSTRGNFLVAYEARNTGSYSSDIWVKILAPDLRPLSGEFPETQVGASSPAQTFTLVNPGPGNLDVETVSITGPDEAMFALQNDNCSNQTLSPGAECTLQVVFSPTSTGEKNADVVVPVSQPPNSPQYRPLTGIGTGGSQPSSRSLNLPAGATAADYRIVSMPLLADDPRVEAVLGPQIGTYNTADMRIGRWNPAAQSYDEYPWSGEMRPGWAGWFLFRHGRNLTFQGVTTPTDAVLMGLSGYAVDIFSGWNQVGNPYQFPVSVSDFIVQEDMDGHVHLNDPGNVITQRVFWVFNNSRYESAAYLAVGQGGWIKKITSGSGRIFFPAVQASPADLDRDLAVPDSAEQPPAPPAGLPHSGAPSSGGGGGGGGCFIDTMR